MYRTDGTSHWIESDGVNDVMTMEARFGLGANPALTIVAAVRPLSYASAVERLLHIGDVGGAGSLAVALGTDGLSWRHNNGTAKFGTVPAGEDHVLSW